MDASTTVDTMPGLIMGGFQVLTMIVTVAVASYALYGIATVFAGIGLIPAFYNCYFYRDATPEVSTSMLVSLFFTALLIFLVFMLWLWMRNQPTVVPVRQLQPVVWQPRRPAPSAPMPGRLSPHSNAGRRLARTSVMPLAEAHTEMI